MITQVVCPICHKPVPTEADQARFFPFCSRRCQEVDLLRWTKGEYAVVESLSPEELAERMSRQQGMSDSEELSD